MDNEFILKNQDLFSMVKRTIKEKHEKEEKDGKTLSSYEMKHTYTSREPDYIKVYNNYRFLMSDSSPALMQFMLAFCENMTYANDSNTLLQQTIRIDLHELNRVARVCDVSVSRVRHAKDALVKEEIFIPVYDNGERLRGVYYVNPWVIGRGDWNTIKEHRESFEYIKETEESKECKTSKTFIREDDEGKKRVTIVTSKPNKFKRKEREKLCDDIEQERSF